MPAIITSSIPPQNFENIRDQIGMILTTELANQYTLNNIYPNVRKVWVERFVVFNSETELPTVNVSIDNGGYDNQNQVKADGSYTFNIDVYTNAVSTNATGPGDQYAMVRMNKIIGMVRAILSNPAYNILRLTPGIVIRTKVVRFFIGDKSTVQDALSNAVGRIQFMVQAIENVNLYGAAVPLLQATTRVRLNRSENGYYYEFNQSGNTYLTPTGARYVRAGTTSHYQQAAN